MDTPANPQAAGILLAAGQSRRFGSDKRLALLDETHLTLFEKSLGALLAHCSPVVCVLRPSDRDTYLHEKALELGALPAFADEAHLGMGHSLAQGAKVLRALNVRPQPKAVLIALADMPWIEPDTYAGVIQTLGSGAQIARPYCSGQWGHPVGLAWNWLPRLETCSGDEGAKALLAPCVAAWTKVETTDTGVLRDVDVPVDMRTKPKE